MSTMGQLLSSKPDRAPVESIDDIDRKIATIMTVIESLSTEVRYALHKRNSIDHPKTGRASLDSMGSAEALPPLAQNGNAPGIVIPK